MKTLEQETGRVTAFWIWAWLTCASLLGCQSTGPSVEPVEELPHVQIVGQESIGTATLTDLVQSEFRLARGNVHLRAAADDAAFAIGEHYRARGFPDVQVSYVWSEANESAPGGTAQFHVTEGRRLSVRKLRVEGNHAIASKELVGLYEGPTTGLLGTGEYVFEKARAESFSNVIEDLYFERGFLEADVSPPIIQWDAEKTHATLTFEVDEGELYELREIQIHCGSAELEAELISLTKPFLDKAFVPSVAYEIRGKLIAHLGEAGYPAVTVEARPLDSQTPSEVALEYSVQTGERVRIRAVEIIGHERTRTSTIRKLLALREGDWYRLSAKRESFDALYGSGLFDSVRLTMKDLEEGQATWVVELEESSTGEFFIEPGYGSYERLRLRAGVREGNLFGLGHVGRADLTAGFISQQAEIGYTNPNFTRANFELDFATYWTRREEPSFLRKELGTGVTLTHKVSEQRRLSLGYRFRNSRATDVEVIDPETLAVAETVNVSSISLSPTHDSRVGVFAPSAGTLTRFIIEYAGAALGSEIDFIRVKAHWATFLPIRDGTIFATSARTGLIIPAGETNEIPIQERFFNGGETTVRSFKQDELGPLDGNGKPIGGEAYTVLSAEIRQQLIGTIQVAAFADTGNVAADSDDYLNFDGFRHALGLGVRYMLPIGPLRLDWGWNPNPQNDEETWVLHLSVGMAF